MYSPWCFKDLSALCLASHNWQTARYTTIFNEDSLAPLDVLSVHTAHQALWHCDLETDFGNIFDRGLPDFLTLLYAGYFYNNLTRGGAQSSSPLKSTKNQGLRINHGRTLKYSQLLGSRKKMGSIRPKLGPYRWNQNFGQNVEFWPRRKSRILTSSTKTDLTWSFLALHLNFLHMDTGRLF